MVWTGNEILLKSMYGKVVKEGVGCQTVMGCDSFLITTNFINHCSDQSVSPGSDYKSFNIWEGIAKQRNTINV